MNFLTSSAPPRPIRAFAESLAKPFTGLWFAVIAYYALALALVPKSQLMIGNLPDPDDYMYLVQVIDWLKGQAFYDNVQHRLNPPDGVMIHFSRLAMIPMAALIWLFEKFGMEIHRAALLTALIYPLFLLAGFLATMRRLAESFMPKDWAGGTAYVALFSNALMYMFQPGHVDHHGLIIWMVAGALLFAVRMMEEPYSLRFGIWAGVTLGLGLTFALEILPWLLIISAWLGIWAAVKGRVASRHALLFALSLHISSIVFLLLTRRPAAFFTFDVLTYSVVYVFLTGGIAVAFAFVALVGHLRLPVRAVVGILASAGTGFLFLHQFPDLIAGPYGAMDPDLVDLILEEANEAAPMYGRIHPVSLLILHLSSTLFALGLGIVFFATAPRAKKWLWGLVLTILLAGFGLTVFYQSRFAGVMSMAAVVPLAVFLQRGWAYANKTLTLWWKRVSLKIVLMLLFAPLLSVILPAFLDPGSVPSGLLLFPAAGNQEDKCDMHLLEPILNDPEGLGAVSHHIVADTWLGPELLFRSNHTVLGAPYHMDAVGNLGSYRFFSTMVPEEAQGIVSRHCLDLVVACNTYPASYEHSLLAQPNVHEFGVHLIDLLMSVTPPDWLREVPTPKVDNYVVYKVLPAAYGDEKSCPVP